VSDLDALVDRLEREARAGCWCAAGRKPCTYHEGFGDGADVLAQALEQTGWLHLDVSGSDEAVCRHVSGDRFCVNTGGVWYPLYRLGEAS
jgi:hypothetical protein